MNNIRHRAFFECPRRQLVCELEDYHPAVAGSNSSRGGPGLRQLQSHLGAGLQRAGNRGCRGHSPAPSGRGRISKNNTSVSIGAKGQALKGPRSGWLRSVLR